MNSKVTIDVNLHYVYKITNIETNDYYIGSRYSKNHKPFSEDMGVVYFTSTNTIKSAFKTHPELFNVEQLYESDLVIEYYDIDGRIDRREPVVFLYEQFLIYHALQNKDRYILNNWNINPYTDTKLWSPLGRAFAKNKETGEPVGWKWCDDPRWDTEYVGISHGHTKSEETRKRMSEGMTGGKKVYTEESLTTRVEKYKETCANREDFEAHNKGKTALDDEQARNISNSKRSWIFTSIEPDGKKYAVITDCLVYIKQRGILISNGISKGETKNIYGYTIHRYEKEAVDILLADNPEFEIWNKNMPFTVFPWDSKLEWAKSMTGVKKGPYKEKSLVESLYSQGCSVYKLTFDDGRVEYLPGQRFIDEKYPNNSINWTYLTKTYNKGDSNIGLVRFELFRKKGASLVEVPGYQMP